MDIVAYRAKSIEINRVTSLLGLIPGDVTQSALDVGARDGHISLALAERFSRVVALDLTKPSVQHARVECVRGDATALEFPDDSFDVVLCAEVLEHIPSPSLEKACAELARVARRYVVVGVPYRQDTRVGRTTCRACGGANPPWGHVNSFDEGRLDSLFGDLAVLDRAFVGVSDLASNWLSTYLMDCARNPAGTYMQDEPCIHCGAKLEPPVSSRVLDSAMVRASYWLRKLQQPFVQPHANWIHVLFEKSSA